ncbi:hypothetical protein DWF00_14780 [Bosea caraganae]|uniref:YkgJ family cysteine cluster protein n=1 Tax=Bosea caraganae TaxID=2763117 RepID=A0A370KZN0_9HYPH|nr:hypothetical protein [Bosea caraganae]RDJ20062.1 hypothetical protein DWE98_26665 [Bosea caraganae]RDJ25669.1 hypothetical protein DWF00_14780 [Bosea caraganae]
MVDSARMVNQPAPGRDCGTCALCCKVYDNPEVDSVAGSWCQHCLPGRGCKIYPTRPTECRSFYCLWMTQTFLGPEWKPDKSRFVLTVDPRTNWLFAQVDPGAAQGWRKEPYLSQFRRWAAANQRPVMVFVAKNATAVLPDREIQLGTIGADERLVLRTEAGSGRQVVEKVKTNA